MPFIIGEHPANYHSYILTGPHNFYLNSFCAIKLYEIGALLLTILTVPAKCMMQLVMNLLKLWLILTKGAVQTVNMLVAFVLHVAG